MSLEIWIPFVLGGTFLSLAIINATFYALFASQIRETMHNRKVLKWFNRGGGSALIGAGIMTAGIQRSA
jgi:threonine/homoserine/homoserine lactone efflux protein